MNEREDWRLREYEQQMRVRPSNISFQDWLVVKGYVKKEEKKK